MKTLVLSLFLFQISHAASLKGIILSKDKDCRELNQLYVTHNKSVVYQVEVPHGGSFEFDLPKNKYTLTATNQSGCSFETEVTIDSKEIFRELWVKK